MTLVGQSRERYRPRTKRRQTLRYLRPKRLASGSGSARTACASAHAAPPMRRGPRLPPAGAHRFTGARRSYISALRALPTLIE